MQCLVERKNNEVIVRLNGAVDITCLVIIIFSSYLCKKGI